MRLVGAGDENGAWSEGAFDKGDVISSVDSSISSSSESLMAIKLLMSISGSVSPSSPSSVSNSDAENDVN